MAEVRRETRKVETTETRYVLDLSADEAATVVSGLNTLGTDKAVHLATAVVHAPAEFAPLVAGDRVRVVLENPSQSGPLGGEVGTIIRVDAADSTYPYLVEFAGDDGPWEDWVHSVEKVGEAP